MQRHAKDYILSSKLTLQCDINNYSLTKYGQNNVSKKRVFNCYILSKAICPIKQKKYFYEALVKVTHCIKKTEEKKK